MHESYESFAQVSASEQPRSTVATLWSAMINIASKVSFKEQFLRQN